MFDDRPDVPGSSHDHRGFLTVLREALPLFFQTCFNAICGHCCPTLVHLYEFNFVGVSTGGYPDAFLASLVVPVGQGFDESVSAIFLGGYVDRFVECFQFRVVREYGFQRVESPGRRIFTIRFITHKEIGKSRQFFALQLIKDGTGKAEIILQ